MSIKKVAHGLGGRLKLTRIALGYTQPELAAIAGVNRNTITSWELGKTDLPCSVAALLDGAGCNSLYILVGSGEMLRRDPEEIRAALESSETTEQAT